MSAFVSILAFYSCFGSENMNSVPTPSVLITFMFSPWFSIISFVIESPSQTFPRLSFGMPIPWSFIDINTF